MNDIIGKKDIIFITFDTLRYDVAKKEMEQGGTPNLKGLIPEGVWEKRHSPGNFTYAAHHAFFAGFLPTPVAPGPHSRLFAASFSGSETTGSNTFVFNHPNIVSSLAHEGYYTACIGGVGFFNKIPPLGNQFPDLFQESHWERKYGVTDPDSTKHQINCALKIIKKNRDEKKDKLFLFINISALHQPNLFYLKGAKKDSIETHAAALRYIDNQLAPLFKEFENMNNPFIILSSDHGTAYGEDGYEGHRLSHEVVWNVPFTAFCFNKMRNK